MYMAFIKTRKKITYTLRESVYSDKKLIHRNLFDLGPCPGAWINYPGGNAWYVDPNLENIVSKASKNFNPDGLEELFWPWVRPDIRQAVEAFRSRGGSPRSPGLTKEQKKTISQLTHAFDKRRSHFLKFANMDQGPMSWIRTRLKPFF